MKGKFPWQKASIMCKPYWEWEQWLKRKNPALPKKFNPFSEKALKLFKKWDHPSQSWRKNWLYYRSLTPRSKDRWSAKDMRKCLAKEKLLKSVKVAVPYYWLSSCCHFCSLNFQSKTHNHSNTCVPSLSPFSHKIPSHYYFFLVSHYSLFPFTRLITAHKFHIKRYQQNWGSLTSKNRRRNHTYF